MVTSKTHTLHMVLTITQGIPTLTLSSLQILLSTPLLRIIILSLTPPPNPRRELWKAQITSLTRSRGINSNLYMTMLWHRGFPSCKTICQLSLRKASTISRLIPLRLLLLVASLISLCPLLRLGPTWSRQRASLMSYRITCILTAREIRAPSESMIRIRVSKIIFLLQT